MEKINKMNKLDKQYQDLLQSILDYGVEKKDRTGTGTKSIFGYTVRHNMQDGFPLLTTKKMAWKQIVTELLWFLRGDTNIKFLVDNGCHIWDGDCFANYIRNFSKYVDSLPENGEAEFIINKDKFINKIKTDDEFAKKWGELGPVYGKQWRHWTVSTNDELDPNRKIPGGYRYSNGEYTETYIDQISNLIHDLKTNPDSRRLMVNAWNVGELDSMVLPPCHYGFQVYTRELTWEERFDIHKKYITEDKLDLVFELATNENLDKLGVPTRAISLMYNARSQDVPLGTPFNLASYGLLLMILAKEVNMVPDELITNMGDCHIYLNQIDGVKEQLTREPFELPTLSMDYREGEYDKELKGFVPDDFVLFNYQSHPTIKIPLSN
jgi:thymidylate synthase